MFSETGFYTIADLSVIINFEAKFSKTKLYFIVD
jgi:hypothetical protein